MAQVMIACAFFSLFSLVYTECHVYIPQDNATKSVNSACNKKYVCWPRLLIIRFGIEVRLEPKIELWLVSQSTR